MEDKSLNVKVFSTNPTSSIFKDDDSVGVGTAEPDEDTIETKFPSWFRIEVAVGVEAIRITLITEDLFS